MDGQLLSETFVELTDTMVAGFDVIDFLHVLTDRSVQLLDVSAAGLLLADPRGELRVVAASSEAVRLLELFQLQNDQGPCLDCFRAGRPVAAADLSAEAQRWPRFAAAAQQAGFAAVQALPMRLRDQVIGALNLFRAVPGAFDPADIRIGQALAVTLLGVLHLIQDSEAPRGIVARLMERGPVGAENEPHHATCEYSWRRPPSRSRLRTRTLSSAVGAWVLPSGGFWLRVR